MRLEDLHYFVEVAHCKSINQAAKNLFITQPALTKALNSLEKELACQLLIRTHRGVLLTPQGERLLSDAEQILSIADGWKTLSDTAMESGNLYIGANPCAYNYLIAPLQVTLQERYPMLNIFSYEIKNQNILSQLENGSISIGIISVTSIEENDFKNQIKRKKIKAVTLYTDILDVFMSAQKAPAKQTCLTTEDLADESLALYPEQDDTISSPIFSKFFKTGHFYRLSNLNNILQVIKNGKAVGIFPRLMLQNCPFVKEGTILAHSICDFELPLTFYLVTRENDAYYGISQEVQNAIIQTCKTINTHEH